VVPADSVGWDVADGRTTHIWAVLNPPRSFGLDGELAPDLAAYPFDAASATKPRA